MTKMIQHGKNVCKICMFILCFTKENVYNKVFSSFGSYKNVYNLIQKNPRRNAQTPRRSFIFKIIIEKI